MVASLFQSPVLLLFFPISLFSSSPTYCCNFSSSKFQGGSLNEHLPQHQCQCQLAINLQGYSCMGCLAPLRSLCLTFMTYSDSTSLVPQIPRSCFSPNFPVGNVSRWGDSNSCPSFSFVFLCKSKKKSFYFISCCFITFIFA